MEKKEIKMAEKKDKIKDIVERAIENLGLLNRIESIIEDKFIRVEQGLLKLLLGTAVFIAGIIFIMAGIARLLEALVIIPGLGTVMVGIFLALLGIIFIPRKK